MSARTEISWADSTWSPVTGCTKVSPGCAHCYAERIIGRFGHHPNDAHLDKDFSHVVKHHDRLDIPLHWRKPRRIFVCSMGDLFHEAVSSLFRLKVCDVMQDTPWHTYLLLTKRAEEMRAACLKLWGNAPLPNVWLGVSVEDQQRADERIPLLLQTLAAVRVVSVEPMLGPVRIPRYYLGPAAVCRCPRSLHKIGPEGSREPDWATHSRNCPECGADRPIDPGIGWVILGCESGPRRRYCDPAWMLDVVRQCREAGVSCHVKQVHLGTPAKFRVSHDPAEWPEELRVREVPT